MLFVFGGIIGEHSFWKNEDAPRSTADIEAALPLERAYAGTTTMRLTDIVIRKAKSADKPARLFDGGGLYLEVPTSGNKRWRWKYRIAGREKRLSLGIYPDVSLAMARERHAAARKLLAEGIDPGEQRKAHKAVMADKAANSFEAVAGELLAMRAKKARPPVSAACSTRICRQPSAAALSPM